MFCESRKFVHEVIPAVNDEARPLLNRTFLRWRSVLEVPVSHPFATRPIIQKIRRSESEEAAKSQLQTVRISCHPPITAQLINSDW